MMRRRQSRFRERGQRAAFTCPGRRHICSHRPSCVGLTTPATWAPPRITRCDASTYLGGGGGPTSFFSFRSGSGGADRAGSHRLPNSVPRVRNSCARRPARSRLSLRLAGSAPSDGSRSFRFLVAPSVRNWLDMPRATSDARHVSTPKEEIGCNRLQFKIIKKK